MKVSKAHQKKFAEFIKMCWKMKGTDIDIIVIHHPAVLGDNYEEIITNLDLLAESGLKLIIVPPGERQ